MNEMLPSYVTGAVGLVILVVVVLVALGRLRRFSRVADRLRADLSRRTAALPAMRSRSR